MVATLDPDYERPALDENAKAEIDKLLNAPFTLASMRRPVLLLGAASGLQIGTNHQIKFPTDLEDERKGELREQLSKCFGPHVGSYDNKIFKRFMYATRLPIVLFLTGDKIDREIEVDHCHFILDSEVTWEQFCRDWPVAFCVGCSQNEFATNMKQFKNLEFELLIKKGNTGISTFIARNKKFIDEFENAPMPKTRRSNKT